MIDSTTITFPATLDGIVEAAGIAETWLAARHPDSTAGLLASLAIEEIVTNCIKYGYEDKEEHRIEVRLELDGNNFSNVIVDDGRKSDPLQAPAPDLSASIEERTVGGVGLHMLRALSDNIIYQRIGNHNRLEFQKQLKPG